MKIGLLVKDRQAQELSVLLPFTQWFFDKDHQFYVFAEDTTKNGYKFPFPFMQLREAWEFDGAVLTVQPDIAKKMDGFASPEHKFWIVSNFFWMASLFPAPLLYDVFKTYNKRILFMNNEVKQVVKNSFGVDGIFVDNNPFKVICENFTSTTKPISLL